MAKWALVLSPCLLAGCGSYRSVHRSPLVALRQDPRAFVLEARDLRRHAARFEDAIVRMADEFGVPLHQVAPVQVYHLPDQGRSYYNRLTRAIVLRGRVEPGVFAHELSHLFAHRLRRSPPYWSDQALADYMGARFGDLRGSRAGEQGGLTVAVRQEPPLSEKERHLARRIALERDPAELLEYLTPGAVDEERSWGPMVVRYLFEERWADLAMPERIRRLLALTPDQVLGFAPDLVEYCRRPDLLASGGVSGGAPGGEAPAR